MYFTVAKQERSRIVRANPFPGESVIAMSTAALHAFVDVHELRKEAGRWLRELREGKGLSQREVAERTRTEYYTFVSQLETGRGRIPPEHYTLWAEALGVEAKVFVRRLMRYYDPVTHDILFPPEAEQ